MIYDKPDHDLFKVLREDVSDEIVKKLLQEQRETGLFMRFSLLHWDILKETHPNLSRYIAITSYQAAPDNPLMREKIAASLLGLCLMMDETIAKRFAQRLEDAKHLADTTALLPKQANDVGGDASSQQPGSLQPGGQ